MGIMEQHIKSIRMMIRNIRKRVFNAATIMDEIYYNIFIYYPDIFNEPNLFRISSTFPGSFDKYYYSDGGLLCSSIDNYINNMFITINDYIDALCAKGMY